MKRKHNAESEPNIRRIDTKLRADKQTHGFQVHVMRGTDEITKMFSDGVYGGKEGARRAARKFKRAAVGDLPERTLRGRARAAKHSKRASRRKRRSSR
jgi:hypothetical protein